MQLRTLSRLVSLFFLATLLVGEDTRAQDLHPSRRPSPVGIAKTHLGDTYVKVTYGRPYVRDRDIFGANTDEKSFLVPFGQIWRTGANEATEITVTGPVMLAGNRLEAGTYSIFTIPGADNWVFHVSSQLGLDGTGMMDPATGQFTPNVYSSDHDVFTYMVPPSALPEDDAVDQLTISFERSETGADMVLRWERTEVRSPIRVE
jgi:hypothetical protein